MAEPALHGTRIIDACERMGGAFAAMLLAEQGAEVVKVEPPAGDAARGTPAFHVINRSKRSIVLDLAPDAGRARFRELARDADVVLFDWAPGVAESRGLAPGDLRRDHPRLIVGWLPAFGSRGEYADLAADEALVQAVSAVSAAQYRYDPAPVLINTPIVGYAQAVVGAVAAAASLYARARTGAGDAFEVNGMGAVFAYETVGFIRGDGSVWRSGQVDPRGPIPTYRLVRGSDGGWLFSGALTPPFWAKLAIALGLDECLVDERFAHAPMGVVDLDHRNELAARVDAAFATKSRDEWLRILEEADVPRAPVNTREEYARDPQVLHQRMMVDVHDPELGATRQMGVPVTLRESPGGIAGPAPRLGEHDAQPWPDSLAMSQSGAGAGLAPPASAAHSAFAHPLQDITVLDLGGFIAGANGSMMLADVGANVIKIEAPEGDGWRSAGLAFLGSNRGKRSCVIDLKKPEGRALFLDLVERADVVLDNMRAGAMERLGIGYDDLHARNPRIVHTSVTGYGPDGPYAHLPGFDPLMQARSGIMRAQGDPDGEPVFLQMPVCDYTTALTAAFGTLVALVARERTGAGDRVETSLLASAFTVQAGEFIFYDGKPDDPPGARDLHGRSPVYRAHATSDGYVMFACTTDAHVRSLAAALALDMPDDPLSHPCESPLAEAIALKLAERTTREWLDALLPTGVPVAPCLTLRELFESDHARDNDLWYECEHPDYGHIRQTGAVIRWDAMSMHLQRRAPLLGEHTEECLEELLESDPVRS